MTQKTSLAYGPLPEPLVEPVLATLGTAHPEVEVTVAANEQEFPEQVLRADAAMMLLPGPELVALVPRLRWLQMISVSLEGILTSEAKRSDVVITVTRGPRGSAIAEHVAMFMLAPARRLPGSVRDHQQRLWNLERVTTENP